MRSEYYADWCDVTSSWCVFLSGQERATETRASKVDAVMRAFFLNNPGLLERSGSLSPDNKVG